VKSLRAGLFLFFIAGCALSVLWSRPGTELRGFLPASAAMEMDIEKTFRAVPTPERARLDLWTLTAEPHIAGTPEDLKTAHFVLEQFRAAGLDAEIVEYHALLPMPKEVKVDLVEPFDLEARSCLQCLLSFGRRDGAGRLCELRPSRGF
jgi:N-acetylated-alpha-linked acidic dipeptidase